MEDLKQLTLSILSENEILSPEKIINVFCRIGEEGDTILLQNGGANDPNNFSIIIIFSDRSFENIRLTGQDLSKILKTTMSKYAKAKKYL